MMLLARQGRVVHDKRVVIDALKYETLDNDNYG